MNNHAIYLKYYPKVDLFPSKNKFKWNTQNDNMSQGVNAINIVHQMKKDFINPFNLECWNWGENDHKHMLSKCLKCSLTNLPTVLMHRICDKIKPGYHKTHIMYILHTYTRNTLLYSNFNTLEYLHLSRLAQSSRPHRLRVDLSCRYPSSSLLPEVSSILFFVACIALLLPVNAAFFPALVRWEKVLLLPLLLLLLLLPCSQSFRDFLLLQRGYRRVRGHHHVREGVWSAQGWTVCSIQPL
jgi:hypothetical protein